MKHFLNGRCSLLSIIISTLALLATFYQLYLQRVHNEKSLRPLGQINVSDRNHRVSVCVANNGMGPMVIDGLTFFKEGNSYKSIDHCLSLAAGSYSHIVINDSIKKVILPNASLEVFAAELEPDEDETQMDNVRNQLSPIIMRVNCRDIYDNRFTFERNLEWFSRHITDETVI